MTWRTPDVPHKGWTEVAVCDLGKGEWSACEMCGTAIRYVHELTHPRHPTLMQVGCVCAENMTEDYVTPRLHEKKLKAASRKRRWRWRTSKKLNQYLNHNGRNHVVHQGPGGWWITVTDLENANVLAHKGPLASERSAIEAVEAALLRETSRIAVGAGRA